MPRKATVRLAPRSGQDFSSQQRARTEALRALAVWQAREKGRRFSIMECRDDFVISRLTWRDADLSADPDLGASCDARCLEHRPIDDA